MDARTSVRIPPMNLAKWMPFYAFAQACLPAYWISLPVRLSVYLYVCVSVRARTACIYTIKVLGILAGKLERLTIYMRLNAHSTRTCMGMLAMVHAHAHYSYYL